MARVMKNSGVAWIGEIPESWAEKRLKYLAVYNDKALDESTDADYQFDYVDIGSVEYGKGIIQYQRMRFHDAPSRARRIVKADDVIISTVRTYLKAVASIPDHDNDIVVSTGFLVLRAIKNEILPSFLKYAVLSDALISLVEASSVGISYPAINASDVVNFTIPVPPLPEQSRIAAFLDRRCAEIDRVIAATQRTIEEYGKLKQSIITEAVTHGVRGPRKMKDSGVEWIGEIPEEWSICKIRQVAEFYNGDRGVNYPSGDDLVSSGVCFITSNNIHELILDCTNSVCKYITRDRYELLGGAKVAINDIIFCLRGSVGNCAINKTLDEGTVASSLCTIRPKRINPGILNYILHSRITVLQTEIYMNGTCAANLSAENVSNYKIPLPAIEEQTKIADYLDRRCTEIDSLIEAKQRLLGELEAYKKSVIYEYVTGKREVTA